MGFTLGTDPVQNSCTPLPPASLKHHPACCDWSRHGSLASAGKPVHHSHGYNHYLALLDC